MLLAPRSVLKNVRYLGLRESVSRISSRAQNVGICVMRNQQQQRAFHAHSNSLNVMNRTLIGFGRSQRFAPTSSNRVFDSYRRSTVAWLSTESGRGRNPRDEEEEERRNQGGNMMSRALPAAATATALMWGKAKYVLGALKFAKVMPFASMLASTGAYAFFFGFPFAVGMVGQIAVHEAGHAVTMRALGIPTGPMVFLPFMGAYVEMKELPKDVYQEALVAFGGPIVGGAAAIGLSVAGVSTGNQLLINLADFGLMINLFNLLPIGSMDGGRIAGAVSPWFLVAGLAGGGYLAWNGFINNPLVYIILLTSTFTTYDRFFGQGTHNSYYKIPFGQRAGISIGYIILILTLLAAMQWNQKYKKSLRQLKAENPQVEMSDMAKRLESFSEEWADDDHAQVMQQEEEFLRSHFGDDKGI